MGSADYLKLGDWNIYCDRCGRKLKASQAKQTWQGYYVCPQHWEPRHPQDFVRSIAEHPAPAFVRNPPDVYIEVGEGIILEDSTDDMIFDVGVDIDYILEEDGDWLIVED